MCALHTPQTEAPTAGSNTRAVFHRCTSLYSRRQMSPARVASLPRWSCADSPWRAHNVRTRRLMHLDWHASRRDGTCRRLVAYRFRCRMHSRHSPSRRSPPARRAAACAHRSAGGRSRPRRCGAAVIACPPRAWPGDKRSSRARPDGKRSSRASAEVRSRRGRGEARMIARPGRASVCTNRGRGAQANSSRARTGVARAECSRAVGERTATACEF